MKTYLIACCLLLISVSSFGTHFRSGYIKMERVGSSGLTYLITVTVYTSTKDTDVKFGGDVDVSYIYFGDGQRMFVPETMNTIRYDIDPDGSIGTASFTTEHTYAASGSYTLHYSEPNRSGGILNMSYSVSTLFYIETSIVAGSDFTATPEILAPPVIFYAAKGDEFSYSLAAKDSSDQTLFYELVNPQSAVNQSVDNYSLPENFSINPVNGLITWDTKFNGVYAPGEYAFAVRIYQYSGDVRTGYMLYDFQIILEDNSGATGSLTDNKDLDENGRIHTPSGTLQKIKILAEDAAADSIGLLAFTELDRALLPADAFTFTSYDSIEGTRTIKVGLIEVRNDPALVRDNPYAIVVRAFYRRQPLIRKDISYLFYTKDVELEVPDLDPDPVLGISEAEELLLVYPNPARSFIFIDERVTSARLIAMDGKMVMDYDRSNGSVIDLSQMKPGVYLLQLKAGRDNKSIVRIVKE